MHRCIDTWTDRGGTVFGTKLIYTFFLKKEAGITSKRVRNFEIGMGTACLLV